MDAGDLKSSLLRRLRRPGLWLGAAGLGLVWVFVRLHLDAPLGRYGLWEVWLPAFALLVILLIAPLPWQWTGDARALAPVPRGIAQAILFNAVWIALLLAGLDTLNPPRRPPMPPPFPPPIDAPHPPPSPLGLDLLHGSLILLTALVAGRVLAQSEAIERRAEAANALAIEARGQALQAQLHPHALFNALSGLTELVHEDPEAAEAALVTLSDFLRRLMRQGAQASAPLGEERALLLLQLRIAELRLGSRLKTEWEWPEWADAASAPPLLLQPLVENALRHGIAARTMGGRLRIRAARDKSALMLEVANTGELIESSREGMGLGNLRERLALLDPPGRLELMQVG